MKHLCHARRYLQTRQPLLRFIKTLTEEMDMPSVVRTTLLLLAFLLMAPALFAAEQEQTTETAQAQPTEE